MCVRINCHIRQQVSQWWASLTWRLEKWLEVSEFRDLSRWLDRLLVTWSLTWNNARFDLSHDLKCSRPKHQLFLIVIETDFQCTTIYKNVWSTKEYVCGVEQLSVLLHQSINQASAASERVFSRAGLSMSPRRSRLQEQTLEMLTFLQCNLRLVPVPKPVAETVAICLRK